MAAKKISNNKAAQLDDFQKDYEKIGKRIKDLRKKAGFTSAEKFALEYGFDRALYSKWEQGKPMELSSIIRLTRAHKMTFAEFFATL